MSRSDLRSEDVCEVAQNIGLKGVRGKILPNKDLGAASARDWQVPLIASRLWQYSRMSPVCALRISQSRLFVTRFAIAAVEDCVKS
jgi:hypothetical protein